MKKLGTILLTLILAVALAIPMAVPVGAADTLVLVSQPGASGDYTQTAGYTNSQPSTPLDPTEYSGAGAWSDAVAVSSPPGVWATISGATWVSSETGSPSSPEDRWYLFKEDFDIPAGATVLSASLEFTADNAVEVYLNGISVTSIGEVYGTPDSTNWWATTHTTALAPTAGANTLMFVVRNYVATGENPVGLLYKAVIAYTEDPSEIPGTVFAYVPNSGEASVSKVDVVANAEVARYSTIPDRVDPDYDPITFYRPVRLVVDSGGNAWALNTMSYEPELSANPGAIGSVARISSTPVGADNTSTAGGLAGIVADDDRVSFFNIGGPADAPRSISIVEEGGEVYLWIGFYVGHYFQKYHYDTSGITPVLDPVADTRIDVIDTEAEPDVEYTPYYTVIDDGYMWVSSRDSGYPTAGENGILLINLDTLDWIVVPYDITGTDGRDIPYALVIASDGRCWVSDSGEPWPRERTFVVYTRDGLSITATEEVPVVLSGPTYPEYPSMCGFIEVDGEIWATEYGGTVLKGTEDASWTFTEVFNPIATGATWLTGVGQDPFGYLWVVSHDMDKLYKFDPAAPGTPIEVPVGDGPYAYALSVVPTAANDICGFKYLAGTEDGLEGWEIILEKWVENASWVEVDRMDTDADGKYCFEDLEAGDYRVSETVEDGWTQVSPYDAAQVGDEWVHLLTLPDDASDCETGPFYNFENVPIVVEKDYHYTNVSFERDNDGDGFFNEDPVDFIDNDGDGLIDEDPVEYPGGNSLGDLLPMDNGNYVLQAVIKKNGKVSSYNPGQYYAVSTVTVSADVAKLTIFEDWSGCSVISALNPPNGGGCVVIVQVGGEINDEPVPDPDAAYQILDATSEDVTIDGNTATAVIENVKAGTTIYMFVKFGPGLKGETWDPPNGHYGPCINYNRATVEDPVPGDYADWIGASANLIVVAKD